MLSCYWIDAFVIINFDENKGATIQDIYKFKDNLDYFDDKTQSDLSFLSLPDKNLDIIGFKNFHFCYETSKNLQETNKNTSLIEDPVSSTSSNSNTKIYGYVSFCQLKDSNFKRGFIQRSFLIISKNLFVSFFYSIAKKLFQLYIDHGFNAIEIAIKLINDWPKISISKNLELPFYGDIYKLYIAPPEETYFQSIKKINIEESEKCYPPSIQLLSNDNDLSVLKYTFNHLHQIYELAILEESVLIISDCPSIVTQYVNALINVCNPLEFCGVYYPYFTIQQSNCKELIDHSKNSKSHYVIGVTNPYFKEVFKSWKYKILISGKDSSKNGIIDKYPFKTNRFINSLNKNCLLPLDHSEIIKFKSIMEWNEPSELSIALSEYFHRKTMKILEPIEIFIRNLFNTKINSSFTNILEDSFLLPEFSYKVCLEYVENFLRKPFSFTNSKSIEFYERFFKTKSFNNWLLSIWNQLKLTLTNRYVEHIVTLNSADFTNIPNATKQKIINFINCLLKSNQLTKEKYILIQDVRNRLIQLLS